MTVGIGVTTRNRPELLSELLRSIQDTTKDSVYTITTFVGIDRDDVSAPVCEQWGVPYGYTPVPGIVANRNTATYALKDCDIIILFEDDTKPIKTGWLERVVHALEPGDIPFLFSLAPRMHGKVVSCVLCKNTQVDLYPLSSAFTIAFPRKTLETIGYWSPAFGERYGFDEAEWGLRAKKAYGWNPDLWPSLPDTEEYVEVIANTPSSDFKSVEERGKEILLNHTIWCRLIADATQYQPYPY